MRARKNSLRIAVSILLVKDRIHQHYTQCAQQERSLNDFKRKHGYCVGRPFCMNMVKGDATSCQECLKANANPRYKRKMSLYGEMRMKERAEERKAATRKKSRAA